MAKEEADREDLLGEASGLSPRAELRFESFSEPILIGFRGAAVSVYVGQNPVYHFNSAGELRRAYRDGLLYKAVESQLVSLNQLRTDEHVFLMKRELDRQRTRDFCDDVTRCVDQLRTGLKQGKFELQGQVPAEEEVVERITQWLDAMPDLIQVAQRPNVE